MWYSLRRAVHGKYLLFCKVNLGDIIDGPRRGGWRNRINRKHVDFVVVDRATTAPLLAIELDDWRHKTPKRQATDAFKDAALRAAGVPIYRIHAAPAYDPLELKAEIERRIGA